MLVRLLLLFTVVPLVELALLLWLAEHTGWRFTIALVLVTGVVGAVLARWQGFHCWQTVQRQMRQGELPAAALLDGPMILLAGALLVTPGILTDLVGFALLTPPVRRMIRQRLLRYIEVRLSGLTIPPRDKVIDVRVIDANTREEDDNGSPDP